MNLLIIIFVIFQSYFIVLKIDLFLNLLRFLISLILCFLIFLFYFFMFFILLFYL